jgi:uncharacterized membrane protein YqjE
MSATDLRPLSALLTEIGDQVQQICRGELELAKAEALQTGRRVKRAVLFFGAAAGLAMFGTTFLLLGGMFVLAQRLPVWAAALVVSAIVLVIAALCGVAGRRAIREARGVPRTMQSIRETLQWPT